MRLSRQLVLFYKRRLTKYTPACTRVPCCDYALEHGILAGLTRMIWEPVPKPKAGWEYTFSDFRDVWAQRWRERTVLR